MERVGPWALKGQLGSGGMGTVYLAERQDGTVAALKVIRADYASAPEFRARFAREVEACARVKGPRVAELVDADTTADRPWLALRYTPGPTLAHHVSAEGPLSPDGTKALAVGLADALTVIWSAGVVHRDLKPSNVILTPSGPVVIDFGIATAAEATSITATGAAVGSAGWMAPEQLTGTGISERADVWGWGAVVLYAATGAGPFGEGSAEALAWRTLHSEPTTEAVAQVPEALRGTVTRALAAKPADRPEPAQLPALAASDVASDPVAEAVTETDHDTLIMGLWDLTELKAPPLQPPAVRPAPPPPVAHSSPRSRRLLLASCAVLLVAAAVIWTIVALDLAGNGDGEEPIAVSGGEEPAPSTTQPPSDDLAEPTAETDPTTTEDVASTASTTTTMVPAIATTDFHNYTYNAECGIAQTFTLDDGGWSSGEIADGEVTLIEAHREDFNNNGDVEAVAHLSCQVGMGNAYELLIVFHERDGSVVQVGGPFTSDGRFERVDGNSYANYLPTYGPNDGLCCPSSYERSYWTVDTGTSEVFVWESGPETVTPDEVPGG